MIPRNIKIFLIIFLISIPAWWGVNTLQKDLEGFFYWYEIGRRPELFLAEINIRPKIEKILQKEIIEISELEIKAQSGIAVSIDSKRSPRILFEKDIFSRRPIASLTKLMTAVIAQEIYSSDQILTISKEAVSQEEEIGNLIIGEDLSLEALLHIMLIESSNDAAWAIAEGVGKEKFVEMMNSKAKELGLKNTYFINPTGLNGFENYSTSEDLVKLTLYIIENHPHILEITRKESYEVLKPDETLHHFIPENTNKLLDEIPEIIGGKTGFTDEAGGCILLVLENNGGYLINVILGTQSTQARFEEMRKLVDFLREYYGSF